ncbi:hypothetical protein FWK35_00017688 [Aphis craccivora]|uniref:Uncharacterized protein n=1 Tax=Aphis craccivora TaxID=307492 RepID=A0A6G0ZCX6_APHCR|nr:hypothetical protein FWK35_00017688 [Aphis craccivora]
MDRSNDSMLGINKYTTKTGTDGTQWLFPTFRWLTPFKFMFGVELKNPRCCPSKKLLNRNMLNNMMNNVIMTRQTAKNQIL